jgi:CHAT domain-containing protein
MFKQLILIFFVSLFLFYSNYSFSNKVKNPINEARQLIEAGNLKDGKKILAAIKNGNNETDFNKYLLNSEIAINQRELELFKSYTDSAYHCFNHSKLRSIYSALVYRNYYRYSHYIILVVNAEKYADSALTIFRQNYKNKDLIPVFTLFQAKASVLRNRPNSKYLVPLMFDSAFYWLRKESKKSAYNKYILTRSYGNFLLDGLNEKSYLKIKNRDSLFKITEDAYQTCSNIIQANFPNNKIELSDIFSLQAICYYLKKDYRKTFTYLQKSIDLLEGSFNQENKVHETYYSCLNYQNSLINRVLTYNDAIAYRKKYLEKLALKENEWIVYTFKNRNKQTGEHRLMYSSNYYSIMLNNSYNLYIQTKDEKYKQLFFQYLQRSKALFFASSINQLLKYKPQLLDLKNFVNDTSTYIDYSSTSMLYEHKTFAFISTAQRDTIIEIGHGHLDQYAENFLITDSLFKSFDHFKTASLEVYKEIIAPILKIVPHNTTKLIISPSNNTSFINFDFLITDAKGKNYKDLHYLFYKYHINYLPSMAVKYFHDTHQFLNNNIYKRLAYTPAYNGKLHSLPFLVEHTQSLRDFGFTIINENKTLENRFETNFQHSEMLELVGHCKTNTNGLSSNYVMEVSDGEYNIKASDLLNLKTNCKMVVLALCEAGRGELYRSDIGNNIANYFMKSGAQSVVYSITKLDDKSAAFILNKYYEYLTEGNTKDLALRKAKFDYLNKAKVSEEFSPLYWAALVVQGNMNPIFNGENTSGFDKETNATKWIIIILFLLITIGLTIYFRLLK